MNNYLCINPIAAEIIQESTPVRAFAEFNTKKSDLTGLIFYIDVEDLRQELLKRGFNTIEPTTQKNIFLIN